MQKKYLAIFGFMLYKYGQSIKLYGENSMDKKYIALTLLGSLMLNANNACAEGKNGIAAVVNGEKITVEEVREAYKANPQIKDRVSFEEFYNKALDGFISGKIVYQQAQKAKIEETPEYKSQLKLAKEELARKIYMEKQVDEKVTDSEIKKLYDEYKETFKSEKEMKAKHILVDDEKTAKDIIAKLKKGEKFDTLAKKYSKDKPELGYFTKRVMVPEFSNAAFAMKKGEYSKTPVKTQFGYHIIMVEDIRDSKPAELKTIKPQLRAMLAQNALAESFQETAQNSKIEKYTLDGKTLEASPKK